MQIALGITALLLIWLAVRMYAHSYANVLDAFALRLHRHARTMREMHRTEEARLNQEWVRELEGNHDYSLEAEPDFRLR